jgi:hypothetical protein
MMDNELKQYQAEMEERLSKRLGERIEKAETNLLTAFHGWTRSMEIRVRGVSGVTAGFDERLALAEERISELERSGRSDSTADAARLAAQPGPCAAH